jgi:putative transposase
MPKKGHSEEQIITALKQYEGGEKTADICRKLGISQATFYMWKKHGEIGAFRGRCRQMWRTVNSRVGSFVWVPG